MLMDYIATEQDRIIKNVMARMYRRRLMQFRMRAIAYLGCFVTAMVAIKPAIDFVMNDAYQSGFADYLGLLSSGGSAVWNVWKDLAFSLLESMPAAELATFLAVVLLLVYSLQHFISVFKDLNYLQRSQVNAFQSQSAR